MGLQFCGSASLAAPLAAALAAVGAAENDIVEAAGHYPC